MLMVQMKWSPDLLKAENIKPREAIRAPTMISCLAENVFINGMFTMAATESKKDGASEGPAKMLSFNPRERRYQTIFSNDAFSWATLENELMLPESFTICSDVSWQHDPYM